MFSFLRWRELNLGSLLVSCTSKDSHPHSRLLLRSQCFESVCTRDSHRDSNLPFAPGLDPDNLGTVCALWRAHSLDIRTLRQSLVFDRSRRLRRKKCWSDIFREPLGTNLLRSLCPVARSCRSWPDRSRPGRWWPFWKFSENSSKFGSAKTIWYPAARPVSHNKCIVFVAKWAFICQGGDWWPTKLFCA